MNSQHLKYVEELTEEYIRAGTLCDVSMAIVTRDDILYRKYWGSTTKDTVFRIFSMTKPLTAVGIYILMERGKLTLLQPLKDILPMFGGLKVIGSKLEDCNKPVTLLDLLNMTSGMAYPGDGTLSGDIMKKRIACLTERFDRGEKVEKKEILQVFADTPLIFQPGEYWHYGVSADVLGMVIEEVSGKSLDCFFEEEIFLPLEMHHSGFWIKEYDRKNLADIYTKRSSGLKKIHEEDFKRLFLRDPCMSPPFLAAGSGLYSTLEDYVHFVQMLLSRGIYQGKRLLSQMSIRSLENNVIGKRQKNSIYFDGMEGYNYGNLMRHLENPELAGGVGLKGEYGWDGLLGNDFFICPQLSFGCIYFQQILEGADYIFRKKMRQIVYAAMEGEEEFCR